MYRFRITDPRFLPHAGCDIDLEINSGDVLTIVGENGVGKSTLMHRIFRENQLNISLIEQRPLDIFYDRPLLRIKNLFLESSKVNREFFLKLWDKFQLARKENRLQSELSGGESQALKLCLGLSLNKDILILDEPSQFLDEKSRGILSEVLEELSREKKGILIVEHDLSWIKLPSKVTRIENLDQVIRRGDSWSI